MFGSYGKQSILNFFTLSFSNKAVVSPGQSSLFSSLKAMIEPLDILGKKYFKATLVGWYTTKSKYNRVIKRCLFFLTYLGIVFLAYLRN